VILRPVTRDEEESMGVPAGGNDSGGMPPPPGRKRGGCLTAFLIIMMIVNPLVAIAYFALGSTMRQNLPGAPTWAIPVLGIFCIVNFASAMAVWRWKRWGFYGFVISAIVALVINIMIGLPVHQVVAGPIGVIVLYALLRPMWDQLEPGV
jgi:hypothetical protein